MVSRITIPAGQTLPISFRVYGVRVVRFAAGATLTFDRGAPQAIENYEARSFDQATAPHHLEAAAGATGELVIDVATAPGIDLPTVAPAPADVTFPATQNVAVTNFPATQPVSGFPVASKVDFANAVRKAVGEASSNMAALPASPTGYYRITVDGCAVEMTYAGGTRRVPDGYVADEVFDAGAVIAVKADATKVGNICIAPVQSRIAA